MRRMYELKLLEDREINGPVIRFCVLPTEFQNILKVQSYKVFSVSMDTRYIYIYIFFSFSRKYL